jgi:hypothetical protein
MITLSCISRIRFFVFVSNVWERGSTRVLKKFEFFFLLKFNMVCTFWIVLMC